MTIVERPHVLEALAAVGGAREIERAPRSGRRVGGEPEDGMHGIEKPIGSAYHTHGHYEERRTRRVWAWHAADNSMRNGPKTMLKRLPCRSSPSGPVPPRRRRRLTLLSGFLSSVGIDGLHDLPRSVETARYIRPTEVRKSMRSLVAEQNSSVGSCTGWWWW